MTAARVHHAARRRGGVAAGGAGAAGRADAAHRRAHDIADGRYRGSSRVAAFQQALQRLGWTDGRNVRIEISLGRRRCRANSQARCGVGRARAGRHPGHRQRRRWRRCCRRPARADRVRRRRRSGRRRLRREPGAAGRQRHRLHAVRVQPECEMAGAAQGDRAERDARGSAAGCRP